MNLKSRLRTSDYDLGLHVIVGLGGTTLSAREKQLLSHIRPSGIIIFKHNIESSNSDWPSSLRKLIMEAQEESERKLFFVAIDHEGGKVHRLPPPITHFPPAFEWREQSAQVGETMGKELRSLGINLNFAPVLDIFTNPQNAVIGHRAFSSEPEEASQFALDFLRGMESAGVMGCGKHFPGHGDTLADSHFELPVAHVSPDALYKRELYPFTKAIASGLRMVMTAHVIYPCLDPIYPATVSSQIIKNLLRTELGYQGVVVTDALEMGAMSDYSPQRALLCSLSAGSDIALFATPGAELPLERAERALVGLTTAHLPSLDFLQASAARINRAIDYMQSIYLPPVDKGESRLDGISGNSPAFSDG